MKKILVLKVGTQNLMVGERLEQGIFNDLARQVALVQNEGKDVVIVSSGAIQAGRERVSELGLEPKGLTKKDLAGLGSRHLLNKWGTAFDEYHKDVVQFWLTFANWQDLNEIKNIKTGISNCLESKFIPVVNENDVISDAEIIFMERGFSENDRLARMVATLISAEGVLFLTDAGGIYEQDPLINPRAKMYEEFNPFSFDTTMLSGISSLGKGGIRTKIEEARGCFLSGMKVAIAGNEEDVLIKFSRGQPVGTRMGKFNKLKE
jgi:glutamate 5-kinase